MEDMDEMMYKRKINLLGDAAVGKTSLILRYVKNQFGDEYLKTIGTNVYKKTIEFEGGSIILIIQDMMGEKDFKSVQEGAFRGSSGAIAVSDVTRPETYDSLLENWLPKYREMSDKDNPILFVGNKYDLISDESDIQLGGVDLSQLENMVLTSAKTGRNVEYLFRDMASRVKSNLNFSLKDMNSIIEARQIGSSRELLDALLAISSNLGDIPYETMEKMLKASGIDKGRLTDERNTIEESKVLAFADKLMNMYEEEGDDYSYMVVENALNRYLDMG